MKYPHTHAHTHTNVYTYYTHTHTHIYIYIHVHTIYWQLIWMNMHNCSGSFRYYRHWTLSQRQPTRKLASWQLSPFRVIFTQGLCLSPIVRRRHKRARSAHHSYPDMSHNGWHHGWKYCVINSCLPWMPSWLSTASTCWFFNRWL